jgi:uncharacterized cupredoxin-like copper-binding protein
MVAALLVLATACGTDGPNRPLTWPPDASGGSEIAASAGTPESPRTIEVAMVDIAFEPTALSVRAGETVKFVFTNDGAAKHEATFGDEAEQEEHATAMREAEGMDMDEAETGHGDGEATDDGHDEQDEIAPLVLEPGASGEVIVTFDDPDVTSTIIGCHVPGHWEAGMRMDVTFDAA